MDQFKTFPLDQRYYSLSTGCSDGGDCRYTVTGLDANSSYSILIVAANSATDDPETVVDVTPLGSRYLVLVVGTEDAKSQLATCTHIIHTYAVTFTFTHIVVVKLF